MDLLDEKDTIGCDFCIMVRPLKLKTKNYNFRIFSIQKCNSVNDFNILNLRVLPDLQHFIISKRPNSMMSPLSYNALNQNVCCLYYISLAVVHTLVSNF